MKKNCFFAVIMTLVMAACGSDHNEFQINVDEVQFGNRYSNDADVDIYSSDDALSQIFEVP